MGDLNGEHYDTLAVSRSDGMLRRESGRLLIDDVLVDDLVERFGSPLFVMSERALRLQARRIVDAFERAWPGGQVLMLPAMKANPVVALQRIIAQEGFGSDLVGAGELEVAVRAGINPDRISLNGTAKDRATIERAVRIGARITIDDTREIELAIAAARKIGKRAVLRMRLRPYVDTEARMQAFGVPITEIYGKYKSGIPYDDLAEAGRALAAEELDVRGVMMHMGRYTNDLDVIGQFTERFGELTAEVSELWGGWTPDTIDIGGGFAPPVDTFGRAHPGFTDPPPSPSIDEYAAVICERLAKGLAAGGIDAQGRVLEIEPGRALYGPCGIHVASVLNVKRQTQPFPFTWYETDSTTQFLTDIVIAASRTPVVPVRLAESADDVVETRVVGRTCLSDVLVQSMKLPEMHRDDLLAFCFTGAYNEAGASNFNVTSRPATVLVNGSQAHLVRRAETIDDVLSRDTVPDYLLPAPIGVEQ